MTSATAARRETHERNDASMRGSASSTRGSQKEPDADTRAGWLRLDE